MVFVMPKVPMHTHAIHVSDKLTDVSYVTYIIFNLSPMYMYTRIIMILASRCQHRHTSCMFIVYTHAFNQEYFQSNDKSIAMVRNCLILLRIFDDYFSSI